MSEGQESKPPTVVPGNLLPVSTVSEHPRKSIQAQFQVCLHTCQEKPAKLSCDGCKKYPPCSPSLLASTSEKESTQKPYLLEGVILSKELLGEGSYGSVYRATHKKETVAAKSMHHVLQESPHWLKQFQNEMRIMSKICHPNIVKFIGEYENHIIMEYMDGGSLYRLVDSLQAHERTVSYKQKVSILGDIICALNYLHELHIVHRDISSPNILLTSGLVAKLSDFGMSRSFNSTRLRPGTVAPGCPLYMPPEALVSGEFTEKGDIFSYAIIAIELIIEKHPHPNEKEDDRKNFCSKANEIPGLMPLEGLVEDCLDCEPQNRPSANDIVLKLKNILDSLPEDQGKPTPWQPKPYLKKPVQVSEMHQITSPRIILSTNGKYGSVLCPDQSSLGSVHGDSELGEEDVDEENCETQKDFHEVWEDKVDEDGKIEKQNIEMEHESKPRECVSSVGPAKECTDASNQESGVDGSTLVCLKPASTEDCVIESVKSQLVVGFNSQKGLQTQFCLDLNSTLESELSPLGCLTRAEVASESGPNEVFESEVGHTLPRDRENNCSDRKSQKGSDSPKQSRDNKVEDGKKGNEKNGEDEEATQKAKTPMKPAFKETDKPDYIPVNLKPQQFSNIPATDSQLASLLCLTLALSLPTLLKARPVFLPLDLCKPFGMLASIQSREEKSTTTTQKTGGTGSNGGGKETSEDGLNETKRDGTGHSSHARDGENDNNSCIKGGSPKHRQNSHRNNIRDNYPRSEKRTKAKMPTMECLVFSHHWDPMATTYCFSVEDQFRLPNIFCLTLALSLPTLLKIKPTFPPLELCTPLQMISLPPSKESSTTSHASDSSSSENGGKDRSGPNEMFKGEIGHTLPRGRDKNSDSKNLKGSDSRKQRRDEVEDGKKRSENDGEDEEATQKAKTPMKPAFKETDKSDYIPVNLKPQQFSNIPATDFQLPSLLCLTLALSLPTLLKARPIFLPLDLCKPFGMLASIQSTEERSTTTTQKTGGTGNNGGGKETSEDGLNESKRDGAGHSSHARDGENDNNSCIMGGSPKHRQNSHRKNIRDNYPRSEKRTKAKMPTMECLVFSHHWDPMATTYCFSVEDQFRLPNIFCLTLALSLPTLLKIKPTFPPLELCTPLQMISLPPSKESSTTSHASDSSSSENGGKDRSGPNEMFKGEIGHTLPRGRDKNSDSKNLKGSDSRKQRRDEVEDGKKGSENDGEDEEATQKAKTPRKPAFKETDKSDHIPVNLKPQQFSNIPATDSQLASLLCLTLALSLPTLLKARPVFLPLDLCKPFGMPASIQSREAKSTTTTQKTGGTGNNGGGKDTSEKGLNESKRDGAGHSSHARDGENDNNSCTKGGSQKHGQNCQRKNIRDNNSRSEVTMEARMSPNFVRLTVALSLPTILKIQPTFPPLEVCMPVQMISLLPSTESTTNSHGTHGSSSEDGDKDASENRPNKGFEGGVWHSLPGGREENSGNKDLKRRGAEDGKKGSEETGEDEEATQKAKTPMKPAFKETDMSDYIPVNLKPQQFSNIPATDSQLPSLLCLTLALSLPTLLKARPVFLPLDLCKPFGMLASIQSREEKSTTTTQKTGGTGNNGGGKETSEDGLNESKRDGTDHSSRARDGENDNNSCTKGGSPKHGKNCHRKNLRSRSEATMEAKMLPNFVCLTVALSLPTLLKIQPTFPPLEVCMPVQMISLPPSTESTTNSHGSHGSSSEDGDKDASENRPNKGFEGGVWHSLPGGREENSGNKDLKRRGAEDGKKGSEETGEDEEATQKAKTPMKPAFKETDMSDYIPVNLKPQQFSNIPATDSQLPSLLCLTLALSLPTLLKARPVFLPLDLCKPFGMLASIQSREEKSTTTTQKTGGTGNNGGGKETSEDGLNESKRDGTDHSSRARDGENDNNSCTKGGSPKHGKNCHRKNLRSRSEATMEAKMLPNFVCLTVALSLPTLLKIQPTFPPLEVCMPVQMISLPPSTESTTNSHGSHGSSSEDGDKDASENRPNKGFEGGVWHSLPGGREENSGNKDLKRRGAEDGKERCENYGEDEGATQGAKTPMKPSKPFGMVASIQSREAKSTTTTQKTGGTGNNGGGKDTSEDGLNESKRDGTGHSSHARDRENDNNSCTKGGSPKRRQSKAEDGSGAKKEKSENDAEDEGAIQTPETETKPRTSEMSVVPGCIPVHNLFCSNEKCHSYRTGGNLVSQSQDSSKTGQPHKKVSQDPPEQRDEAIQIAPVQSTDVSPDQSKSSKKDNTIPTSPPPDNVTEVSILPGGEVYNEDDTLAHEYNSANNQPDLVEKNTAPDISPPLNVSSQPPISEFRYNEMNTRSTTTNEDPDLVEHHCSKIPIEVVEGDEQGKYIVVWQEGIYDGHDFQHHFRFSSTHIPLFLLASKLSSSHESVHYNSSETLINADREGSIVVWNQGTYEGNIWHSQSAYILHLPVTSPSNDSFCDGHDVPETQNNVGESDMREGEKESVVNIPGLIVIGQQRDNGELEEAITASEDPSTPSTEMVVHKPPHPVTRISHSATLCVLTPTDMKKMFPSEPQVFLGAPISRLSGIEGPESLEPDESVLTSHQEVYSEG